MTSSVSPESAAQVRRMLMGLRVAQAISTAASMGVADALANGERSSDELAGELRAHPQTLYRLLRALAAAGLLTEGRDRRFALTDLGSALRSDVPGSVREQAIVFGRPEVVAAWGNLEHSIRTGENAFTALHGEDIWSWRSTRPELQSQFNRAMASASAPVGPALAEALDVTGVKVLADIGGGNGTLLAAVLARHLGLRGIVFDQPNVVAEARPVLDAAGVRDRAEPVGGSFFESVPAADLYVMKAIIHDWADPESIAILRTIHAASPAAARLALVERVLGEPNDDLDGKVSDLHMLVMPGGMERTLAEWRALLAAGGWELHGARPLVAGWQLIESSRVPG